MCYKMFISNNHVYFKSAKLYGGTCLRASNKVVVSMVAPKLRNVTVRSYK